MRASEAESGFTLIETLVALVILSLVLSSFYTMISVWSRASTQVSLHQNAVALARSHLDSIGRETPLEPGSSSGTYKNGLQWRLTIDALAPDETRPMTSAQPYRILLEILDRRGRPLLSLETVKLGVPPS